MSGDYRCVELTPEQVVEAMFVTHMDIVFAGSPEGTVLIRAAHAATHSYVLMRHEDGKLAGWKLEGDRETRQLRYREMCTRFAAEFGGQLHP